MEHSPSSSPPDSALPPRVSFSFARRHGGFINAPPGESPVVVIAPHCTAATLLELRRAAGRAVAVRQLGDEEFAHALRLAYETGSRDSFGEMEELDQELDLDQVARELAEPKDLMESADDAPIIRLINALLTEAVKENASDIHIEPYEERLKIRFRVDGILREVLEPKRGIAPLVVSRIKVMGRLDIAEKRLPQDGRISLRIAGRPVDVRVSTLPTGHGERVVLRLLDKQAGRLEVGELGMVPFIQSKIEELIGKPNGIILVTGPTGSGKTTTLYAILERLNHASRNILTVEDPVEYHLEGIGQTHVNTKVDLTFARGLRAILRQDPDVVMVGEIRDLETARVAVQASLTGHLVFSTLHTNSAIGAMTRLRDMGVEPFLLSTSLLGVLAQRLVRRLCPHCKRNHTPSLLEREALAAWAGDEANPLDPAGEFFTAVGCARCNFSGFKGRLGIYELITLDDQLRAMVHDGMGEAAMLRYLRPHSPSLRDDGLRLAHAGATTLDEVLRVTRDD